MTTKKKATKKKPTVKVKKADKYTMKDLAADLQAKNEQLKADLKDAQNRTFNGKTAKQWQDACQKFEELWRKGEEQLKAQAERATDLESQLEEEKGKVVELEQQLEEATAPEGQLRGASGGGQPIPVLKGGAEQAAESGSGPIKTGADEELPPPEPEGDVQNALPVT